MATEVETGHGSIFELANESGTLTPIGEPFNIPIPNGAAELIDVSHHQTVGFREHIQSPLKDGDEAEIEMNWVPGSDTDAMLAAAVDERRAFRIEVPARGGTYEWSGEVLVRNYIRNNPMDDRRTGTLVVKWQGEVTETYNAAP